MPPSVTVKGSSYTLDSPKGEGFKSVVWKAQDDIGRLRALKFAVYEDYEDRSYLQELSRASALDKYEDFARFIDAGLVNIDLEQDGEKAFVCFVEEWIEGISLKDLLSTGGDRVTPTFMLGYIRAMCNALNELSFERLRHDDLHSGNVMIVEAPQAHISPELRIKIVDNGSMKSGEIPTKKEKDDHGNFVAHLVEISNVIRSKRSMSIRDRRFLSSSDQLIQNMVDRGQPLRDPRQIVELFDLAYTRATSPTIEAKPELLSPFEFISAEHIADDRLLLQIFAKTCPWLEKVAGPDPCLISGPRGCGKSTIFRWLSLKPHLHKPATELSSFRLAGFYISCSTDLQNRVGWIRTEALAKRFAREIVHYFNLLATREVVQTLALITERDDRESYWGLGPSQEQALHTFVLQRLHLSSYPLMQGISRFAQLMEIIEQEMFVTHSLMMEGLNVEHPSRETMLGDLSSRLVQVIPRFKEMRITFLVDDFSLHRIPEPVQKILNRIIWERRSTHIFKLSSEKFGAVLSNPYDTSADISREMIEIDCGQEFIALDEAGSRTRARDFAIDLLNHRLGSAKYAGTAVDLIGHSPPRSLALSLLKDRKGRQAHYYGLERLADLCSGDVSNLLLVYRRIFEAAKVDKSSTSLIAPSIQDSSVRAVSRELLESIRAYVPFGVEMHSLVLAFGNLVRNILEKGRWIKKGKKSVPPQCPRIEIDQVPGATADHLTPAQQEQADELLRRAVFINMGPGLSRHKNVLTIRWHLRRIYLPAFGAALSKNVAVKSHPDWFKFFLTDARGGCEMIWKAWAKTGNLSSEEEPPLFRQSPPTPAPKKGR